MRGVVCDGSSIKFRSDLPTPGEAAGETILRVRMAGICDTDIQLARGYMGFRGILGHEFVGEDHDGNRFAAEINCSCRACPVCLSRGGHHCPNRTVLGILGRDGAMADQVRVPTCNLHAIPDAVEDRAAVFVEPLAAAFRILEQIPIQAGDDVAVLGDGKLGMLCAWVLRGAGARVTLIGKYPEKLVLAGEGIEAILLDATAGRRFSIVVDATGNPSGFATALGLVRAEGTVVLKTTIAGEHAMSLAPIVIDEVRVIGSRCGPFAPAIAAMADGSIDVTSLIGAVYPLDHAEAAFQAAGERGARKILLDVGGGP